MDLSKWITRFRKSLRSKKSPLKSPRVAQVAGVSLVVLVSVGALAVAAHLAEPAIGAAPAVTAVAAKSTAPATVRKTNVAKAHPANSAAATQTSDAVTITGCLEQDHDTFKLKGTSGADVPKSRSWKTGFITKRSSTVTVLDGANNRLQLGTHVGERVSVSGSLVDRELQGRSLQMVTASCE